eukprot:g40624.t1
MSHKSPKEKPTDMIQLNELKHHSNRTACKKSSNPLLVELLLNHGTREQDIRKALEVSIKMGDERIISLLLRKLGLDQNNKAICLGGLHMGKIEATWLYPLFSNETFPSSEQPL